MTDGGGQHDVNKDDRNGQETPSVVGNSELNMEKAGVGSKDNSSENTIMMINADYDGDDGQTQTGRRGMRLGIRRRQRV